MVREAEIDCGLRGGPSLSLRLYFYNGKYYRNCVFNPQCRLARPSFLCKDTPLQLFCKLSHSLSYKPFIIIDFYPLKINDL